MVIRKSLKADMESLFAVYRQARNPAFFKEAQIADFQAFEGIVKDEDIYLAVNGDQITGFISVYSPQSFVHHLYVLPEFQKQGIGRALINHARKIFDPPLSLKCERINKPAIEFYKKNGWKLFDNGSETDGTEFILLTLDFE